MEIKFLITEKSINSMTWGEFETFERAQDGEVRLYQLRPVLARFMVSQDDQPMPQKQALKVLEELSVGKIKEVVELFVGTLKGETIPKASGTPLSSPSEANTPASASPAGSTP